MRFAFARQLLSFTLLPFTVTILVPVWIAGRSPAALLPVRAPDMSRWAMLALAVVSAIVGLVLFSTSLRRFATEGEGTLAPWDPPRHLVVRGPYRYVRNPMLSGVVFVLIAEALFLDSQPQFVWAGIFAAANLTYIPLIEEPGLRRRFGAAYDEYARHVPRLIPRVRPWTPTR